jgi:hypothetical protein
MNTPKTLSAVDEIVNELRFLQSNMENNEEFLKVLAIMVDQVESSRPAEEPAWPAFSVVKLGDTYGYE